MRYLTDQNGPKAHENEFLSIFKFRNECHKQLEWTKVNGKNGVISLVFKFPPRVIVLKLSKKGILFLQFCACLSKKSKYIKTIYIYASEKSCCALSENGIIYYTAIYCFGDIRVWSQRALFSFCWVSIFFDILITNISWTVAQTSINHTIFWKSVMRTFRCIYGKCFRRLRYLAEVSTKLHEMHIFRQFKNNNSGSKHGN